MKRVVDLVVAIVLVVAVAPVVLVCAVVVALSLRSWPFFAQDRVGQDGQVFRFVKIRTLPPSTPAYADKYARGRTADPPVLPASPRAATSTSCRSCGWC